MSTVDPQARGDRIRRLFGEPPANWVRPTGTDHDVLVVGGGQAGLGIGFALRRAGIGRFSVIDAAAPGATGVWTTTARMRTLRTPKAWPEPEFGFPELSFRAWFEERHGIDGYAALDRIPRTDWALYLEWITATVRVPVRHHTRLVDVTPADGGLAVHLRVTGEDGSTILPQPPAMSGVAPSSVIDAPIAMTSTAIDRITHSRRVAPARLAGAAGAGCAYRFFFEVTRPVSGPGGALRDRDPLTGTPTRTEWGACSSR